MCFEGASKGWGPGEDPGIAFGGGAQIYRGLPCSGGAGNSGGTDTLKRRRRYSAHLHQHHQRGEGGGWGPPLVEGDWHAICQAIFRGVGKVTLHFRRIAQSGQFQKKSPATTTKHKLCGQWETPRPMGKLTVTETVSDKLRPEPQCDKRCGRRTHGKLDGRFGRSLKTDGRRSRNGLHLQRQGQ